MTDINLLHLGCGEDYRKDWLNVDYVEAVGPDEVVDLNEYPWPWEDNTFIRIEASHVFEHLEDIEQALRECKRVLAADGTLEITLPMGINAIADPDHKHIWTWQTPEFYCGERHWDVDTGLEVVHKEVSMHSLHPTGVLRIPQQAFWKAQLAIHEPGEWCFNQPSMSGEFTVVFQT